jgi:hypothetical protein
MWCVDIVVRLKLSVEVKELNWWWFAGWLTMENKKVVWTQSKPPLQ